MRLIPNLGTSTRVLLLLPLVCFLSVSFEGGLEQSFGEDAKSQTQGEESAAPEHAAPPAREATGEETKDSHSNASDSNKSESKKSDSNKSGDGSDDHAKPAENSAERDAASHATGDKLVETDGQGVNLNKGSGLMWFGAVFIILLVAIFIFT